MNNKVERNVKILFINSIQNTHPKSYCHQKGKGREGKKKKKNQRERNVQSRAPNKLSSWSHSLLRQL